MRTRLIVAGVMLLAGLFASQTQRGKTTIRGKANHTPLEAACTYYVDYTTGDDSDNGTTEALAWKTVAKVNAATLTAGQVVCFKRGETWNEALLPGQSGSSGSPITFTAYGSGALPKLTGGAEIYSLGVANGISYVNASYLELSNTTAGGFGVIYRGSNSVLSYLTIKDCPNDGIVIDEGAHDVALRYSTLSGNGTNHTGDNNNVGIGNTGDASYNVVVEYCDISASYKNNIHVAMTSTGQFPYNITIQHNRIYNSATQAGLSFDAVSATSLVAFNEIYGNATHGLLILPSYIEAGPITEEIVLSVYHNTIYGNGSYGVYSSTELGGTTTLNFRNNLIAENGTEEIVTGTTGYTYTANDYNLVYHSAGGSFMNLNGVGKTWATWLSSTVWDDNSVNADPTFTNAGAADFTLVTGSPAIGAGVYIPGVSTANPPNVGAR